MGQSCSHVCGFHRHQSSTQLVLSEDTQATPKKQRHQTETQIVTTNDTDEDSEVETEYPASPFPEDEGPRRLRHDFHPARKLQWHRPSLSPPLRRLLEACHQNETDRAREIISTLSEVNFYGSPSENPLLVAIRQKNIEIVAALIEAGAEVNPTNTSPYEPMLFSPVVEAVRVGDVDVLRFICRSGGDLTLQVNGKTVLDIADPRHVDLCDYLVTAFEQQLGNVTSTQKEIARFYHHNDYSGLHKKLYFWAYPHLQVQDIHMTPWMIACKLGWMDVMRRYYVRTQTVDQQDEVTVT